MHLTVIDHRQQPSLNKTKKQPNNQLLTLATLLLNDIYYSVIDTALSEVDRRFVTVTLCVALELLLPALANFSSTAPYQSSRSSTSQMSAI